MLLSGRRKAKVQKYNEELGKEMEMYCGNKKDQKEKAEEKGTKLEKTMRTRGERQKKGYFRSEIKEEEKGSKQINGEQKKGRCREKKKKQDNEVGDG